MGPAAGPHPPAAAHAWDVDWTPAPAYAVSLRLPAGVLADIVAEAAKGGGAGGAPTLAVQLPDNGPGPGRAVSFGVGRACGRCVCI
jgi:hypothetical protein